MKSKGQIWSIYISWNSWEINIIYLKTYPVTHSEHISSPWSNLKIRMCSLNIWSEKINTERATVVLSQKKGLSAHHTLHGSNAF